MLRSRDAVSEVPDSIRSGRRAQGAGRVAGSLPPDFRRGRAELPHESVRRAARSCQPVGPRGLPSAAPVPESGGPDDVLARSASAVDRDEALQQTDVVATPRCPDRPISRRRRYVARRTSKARPDLDRQFCADGGGRGTRLATKSKRRFRSCSPEVFNRFESVRAQWNSGGS